MIRNFLLPLYCVLAMTLFVAPLHSEKVDSSTTSSDDSASKEPPIRPSELIRLLPRRTPNPVQPPPEIRLLIEKFFNDIKSGDSVKAYDGLLLNTHLAERKDNVRLLIDKTDQATSVYGKLIGFEVYDNYLVGSNLMVLTYITTLPMQPLRWRFIFYRPDRNWGLIDLRVDDVLDDLIE